MRSTIAIGAVFVLTVSGMAFLNAGAYESSGQQGSAPKPASAPAAAKASS
jgi:hypothetical protein